jgi:ubiquinone/menaquinone biosynthesis C-methylase UbiE
MFQVAPNYKSLHFVRLLLDIIVDVIVEQVARRLYHVEPVAYDELYQLEHHHWWYRGMRKITATLLMDSLGQSRNLSILDAGCGAGGNLTALTRFGCVVGLDYSSLALTYAGEKHAGKLACASIEALPYQDNSFDLVTSFDVLYHMAVKDDVTALREFARVTRPSGHVLVRVPALQALRGSHDTVVHTARRYSASELNMKLRSANLNPLRITYANSFLMPFIFIIRKLQSLSSNSPNSDVNQTSEPMNGLLTSLLHLEASWICRGHNFPVGVSLFGLAVKPGLS